MTEKGIPSSQITPKKTQATVHNSALWKGKCASSALQGKPAARLSCSLQPLLFDGLMVLSGSGGWSMKGCSYERLLLPSNTKLQVLLTVHVIEERFNELLNELWIFLCRRRDLHWGRTIGINSGYFKIIIQLNYLKRHFPCLYYILFCECIEIIFW